MPYDGPNGGGIDATTVPYGTVFIWSMGKDGKDGFGCSDGSSMRTVERMADGLPSQPGADDIFVQVSTTSCATPTCTE